MEIDAPKAKIILELDITGKLLAQEEEEVLVISLKGITERKHTEEALRDSDERYRAILDKAAGWIGLIDTDTGERGELNERAQEEIG